MSSLFNLPTSDSVPDPSAATDRITLEEVTPRSSSLTGAITIEFTSSPSRWFSPSDSYCMITASLNTAATVTAEAVDGSGNVTTAFVGTWRAPVSDDYVMFARNAGAAFFSSITLSVNGVLMGTLSSPSQLGGVITTTELTKDYCETAGSAELLQTDEAGRRDCFDILDASGSARSKFDIMYRPPFGWLKTMKAYPGARITMQFTVDPSYSTRVITAITGESAIVRNSSLAAPITNRDVRVELNGIKYYAARMTPLNSPPIPSSVVLPMYEIATSAQQLPSGLTAGTLNSLTFAVPSSTFKIGVACQLVSAGNSPLTPQREVTQFRFPYVRHLQVTYAGYVAGSGAYVNATEVGSVQTITFTPSATDGSITLNGAVQSSHWTGNLSSAGLSGTLTGAQSLTVNGTESIGSYTLSSYTVPLGTRSVTLTAVWGQGPMPTDSTGGNVASLRCPTNYSRTTVKNIEGVHPIRVGTSANGFTDHGLVSHGANNIYMAQSYDESGTGAIRHRFALPSGMLDGRSLRIWNYNSNSEQYQNPDTYYWSSSTVTVNSVDYTLMTKTGPTVGASQYLFVFT